MKMLISLGRQVKDGEQEFAKKAEKATCLTNYLRAVFKRAQALGVLATSVHEKSCRNLTDAFFASAALTPPNARINRPRRKIRVAIPVTTKVLAGRFQEWFIFSLSVEYHARRTVTRQKELIHMVVHTRWLRHLAISSQ